MSFLWIWSCTIFVLFRNMRHFFSLNEILLSLMLYISAWHKNRFFLFIQIKINLIFEKKCNLKFLTIKLWNPLSWSCSTFYKTMDKKILCIAVFILLQSLQGKFPHFFESTKQMKMALFLWAYGASKSGFENPSEAYEIYFLIFSLSKVSPRKITLKWCHSWFRPKNQEISQV